MTTPIPELFLAVEARRNYLNGGKKAPTKKQQAKLDADRSDFLMVRLEAREKHKSREANV